MISFSSTVRDATTAQSFGTRFSAGGDKCDFFVLSLSLSLSRSMKTLAAPRITRVIKPGGYSTWLMHWLAYEIPFALWLGY
jgi:hypothetical protein